MEGSFLFQWKWESLPDFPVSSERSNSLLLSYLLLLSCFRWQRFEASLRPKSLPQQDCRAGAYSLLFTSNGDYKPDAYWGIEVFTPSPDTRLGWRNFLPSWEKKRSEWANPPAAHSSWSASASFHCHSRLPLIVVILLQLFSFRKMHAIFHFQLFTCSCSFLHQQLPFV